MPTATDPKDQQKLAADILERLDDVLTNDYPTTKGKLTALEGAVEDLKGLDIKGTLEEYDKRIAAQDAVAKRIKASKGGLYISGVEDEQFNLCRALVAVRHGRRKADWERVGASKEFDILRQVQTRYADQYEYISSKGQNTTEDELGGFFVPDQVIPEVIGAIYRRSSLINLSGEGETRVSVLDGVTGGSATLPKFRGGCIAYWIDEEEEYAESFVKTGRVTATPKKLGILVQLTKEMEELGSYGFDTLLRRDMEEAAGQKVDWSLLYGKGGKMPLGVANTIGSNKPEDRVRVFNAVTGEVVDPTTITDWDPGVLNWDGLSKMELAFEEDDVVLDESRAIVSSPRFWQRLKTLKTDNYSAQSTNQPYLIGPPVISDTRLRELLGTDFAKTNNIPSNALAGAGIGGPTDSTDAKNSDVFDGNWREVIFIRWAGIGIEDDGGIGMGFTKDIMYQKLRMMADVVVRQPRAIMVCPNAKVRD